MNTRFGGMAGSRACSCPPTDPETRSSPKSPNSRIRLHDSARRAMLAALGSHPLAHCRPASVGKRASRQIPQTATERRGKRPEAPTVRKNAHDLNLQRSVLPASDLGPRHHAEPAHHALPPAGRTARYTPRDCRSLLLRTPRATGTRRRLAYTLEQRRPTHHRPDGRRLRRGQPRRPLPRNRRQVTVLVADRRGMEPAAIVLAHRQHGRNSSTDNPSIRRGPGTGYPTPERSGIRVIRLAQQPTEPIARPAHRSSGMCEEDMRDATPHPARAKSSRARAQARQQTGIARGASAPRAGFPALQRVARGAFARRSVPCEAQVKHGSY
jgi:hypothetical protein